MRKERLGEHRSCGCKQDEGLQMVEWDKVRDEREKRRGKRGKKEREVQEEGV